MGMDTRWNRFPSTPKVSNVFGGDFPDYLFTHPRLTPSFPFFQAQYCRGARFGRTQVYLHARGQFEPCGGNAFCIDYPRTGIPNNSFPGCGDTSHDVHPDARVVPDANTGDGEPTIGVSKGDPATLHHGATGLENTSRILFIKKSSTPAKMVQTDAPIHPG